MNYTFRALGALSALLLGSPHGSAQSEIVFSNLTLPDIAGPAIAGYNLSNPTVLNVTNLPGQTWWANAFSVAAGSDYVLDSVTLKLGSFTAGGSGSFFVRVYEASTTFQAGYPLPGASHTVAASVAFDDPRISSGAFADVLFVPESTFLLQAGKTYFVAAGPTAGSNTNVLWRYTDNLGYLGSGGAADNLAWVYDVAIDGWNTTYGPIVLNGVWPNQFAVNATAIPESATCAAMLGLGALGLVVWRRRAAR